jgi:hypothetical protein
MDELDPEDEDDLEPLEELPNPFRPLETTELEVDPKEPDPEVPPGIPFDAETMGQGEDNGGIANGDLGDAPGEEPVGEREEAVSNSVWIGRRDKLIHPGSDRTVLKTAYQLIRLKIENGTKDNAFDRSCKLEHHYDLRPGNFYPPSLHVCKVILGIPLVRNFERHVCVNDCFVFSDLQEEEWLGSQGDACPVCKEARFTTIRVTDGEKAKPRKVFWDFGVEATIKEFFADPEFCKLRKSSRSDTTDFWDGAYAAGINEKSGGQLLLLDNGAYAIGVDWAKFTTSNSIAQALFSYARLTSRLLTAEKQSTPSCC